MSRSRKKSTEKEKLLGKEMTIPERKLFYHVKNSNLVRIKHYIEEEKIDINFKDGEDWGLLHHGVNAGNVEVVNYLVSKKVNINDQITLKEFKGWSALHIAAFKDDEKMIRILVKIRCDPTLKNKKGKLANELGKRKTRNLIKSLTRNM